MITRMLMNSPFGLTSIYDGPALCMGSVSSFLSFVLFFIPTFWKRVRQREMGIRPHTELWPIGFGCQTEWIADVHSWNRSCYSNAIVTPNDVLGSMSCQVWLRFDRYQMSDMYSARFM